MLSPSNGGKHGHSIPAVTEPPGELMKSSDILGGDLERPAVTSD